MNQEKLFAVETFEYEADEGLEAERGRRLRPSTRPTRYRPAQGRPSYRPPVRPVRPGWRYGLWPRPAVVVEEPAVIHSPAQGSEYIRWVQNTLNQVMGLQLPLNGLIGPETRGAISDFQRREGLPVDGIAGPETRQALIAARKGGPTAAPAPADTELAEGGQEDIKRGSRDYIRWVQQSLNRILRLGLATDGLMGPATRSAIRTFQQQRGLKADGLVGPQTEQALIAAGAGQPAPNRPADQTATCAQPITRLEQFGFNQANLVRDPAKRIDHYAAIELLAKRLVDSWLVGQPISTVCLRGHTDERGSDAYNLQLGLRRAQTVEAALRTAIRQESLRRNRPDIPGRINFIVGSAGERLPLTTNRTDEGRSRNRRVDIAVTPARPGTGKTIPPDSSRCGLPSPTIQAETNLDYALGELERTSRVVAIKPRLSLYQNATETSHRNHFNCQAARWARQIGAMAEPDVANCRRRVGPTPYDTGANIIQAIQAAHQCLKKRLEVIHIFSHSGSYGLFGTVSGGTVGLYTGTLDAASRSNGGRTVADIPTAPLSEDVIIVLHGCNTAAGDDNFARALYQHLAASLRNPKVYGHPNLGCAGRDNSWREYSSQSPDGRRRFASLTPHYSGNGCCG